MLLSISKLLNVACPAEPGARVLGSTSDRASSLCQHEQPLGPAPIELASTSHRASSLCQHEKPLGPAPIELASTTPLCRLDWLARCCCQRQLQRLAYRRACIARSATMYLHRLGHASFLVVYIITKPRVELASHDLQRCACIVWAMPRL